MSTIIAVVPDTVWTDPDIDGIEVSEGEWRLRVDRYQEFIAESTGIPPADGLAAADCYRIGNRLQGLIEECKRHDEWTPALVAEYSDINSLDEFLWVARFFRACHDCHDPDEVCFSGLERERSCAPSG
jgi:hypothetical protein